MATQKIQLGVEISDNGSAAKTQKNVKDLHSEIKAAQKTAQNIQIGGGTQGSRAVAARAQPAGSQTMTGQEYGSARGTAGVTGASARDFANQAQGLGGLVRLYATFAANLFAVSAAFSALKNAADTTNLVKGMNQLGAASGIALGTLSKQLVEVTDGAISMREAMQTVTKATSAGLSSKQLLELGKVAKNASQALGVDMEDAVSRLTRGITKLEPELLDELGIFTKIDPAVEKYAQSIGRAASSLTDFERRQAFAIAVLDEGNKKFGEIELAANPYAKLLATLKDVSFTVLDLVNKAVVPLVDYLSKSPTALLTVLGAIGAVIVRQALPAFGQFRAGLESSAEQAQKRAIDRARDAAEAQKTISESVKQAAETRIESEVANVVAAETRIKELKATSINKQSALYKILEKDLEDITDKDLKRIEASAKGLDTRGLTEQAKAYRDVAAGITNYKTALTAAEAARIREQQQIQSSVKWYSIEGITISAAEKAKQQATRASIISNAAYQGSLVGVTRAMIALNAAIVTQGITGIAAFTLRIQGLAAAIGGALATIGSFISRFLGIFGILATAYTILDGVLSGGSEQIGKFDSAVSKANSSAENLAATYKKIYENDPFSAQSVQARGNALMDVADSFKEIGVAAEAARQAIDQSWWLQLKEGLGISGVARNFAKTIAEQITTLLETIDDPAVKKQLETAVKTQLGISEISFDNVTAAAKRLGASSDEIKKIEEVIRGVATQAKIAGSSTSQFAESFKKVTDQVEKINQKFAVTDDIAVFAINSTNALNKLDTQLSQGVTVSAEGLVKALQGIGRGANIFGDQATALSDLAPRAAQYSREMSEAAVETKKLEDQLKSFKTTVDKSKFITQDLSDDTLFGPKITTTFDQKGYEQAQIALAAQREQLETDLTNAEQRGARAKSELEVAARRVQEAIPKALVDSTNLLAVRLSAELAKGANQALQGAYAAFDSIPELAARSSQLKIQEIETQIANTKAMRDLTSATVISAAQEKVRSAQQTLSVADDDQVGIAAQNLFVAEKELELFETAVRAPLRALDLLKDKQLEGTDIARRLGSQIQTLAQQTVAYTVAIRNLEDQKVVDRIKGEVNVIATASRQQELLNKAKLDELKIERSRVELFLSQEGLGLDLREQLNTQQALNREKQIQVEYEEKIRKAREKYSIEIAQVSPITDPAERNRITARTAQDLINAENLAALEQLLELERTRVGLAKQQSALTIERIGQEEAAFTTAAELDKLNLDNALQLKQIKLDTELGVQAALLSNVQISESARAEIAYQSTLKLAALEQERARVQANQEFERQQNINTIRIKKLYAADTGVDDVTAETLRKVKEIDDQQKIQKTTRDIAISQSDAIFNKTKLIADATKQSAQEQDRFNQLLKDSAVFADVLKSVFGEVGESLGKVATTFAEVAKNTEDRAKAERVLQDQINRADPAQRTELEKEQAKQKKTNAREELSDNIKIVASAKNLFKEKSTAFKVLSATEKAMHAYKMATFVIERAQELKGLATKLFATTGKIGATISEAAVSAKSAVIKAWEAIPPPFNIAAAALVAAAVGSLLSKMGGGSVDSGGGSGFVLGAEQRQETQGTGMAYDAQGNKFETGGGVFGDATEKLDSINKSIGVIKNNSIDGLFYDNRMLNALERIAKSITGAAESIYSTPGIRSGLNFGTLPGSIEQGGFLSSVPIIGGILGSIFGGGTSSTTTITDSGIQLRGTLQDIVDAVDSSVMQYKEILTQFTKKGGLFSSGGSWTTLTREINGVSASILESFSEIFKESKALFVSVADVAGIAASEVNRVFAETTTGLDISLLGLKGEDVVKELNASISSQLDVISKQLFVSFDRYRKFGEGYTDTVLRVVDANNKITVALEAMGNTVTNISGNFEASETIIEGMSLSLENFTEQASFFIDNFLTEAERVNVTRTGVNAALADLVLPATLTRTEFRNLVQSLDLSTTAGRKMYQSLQDIAPEFIKVTQRLEDLKTESGKLSTDLLRAQGNTEAADAAVRLLATEGMIPAELAAYDYNESLRKQIEVAKEADSALKQRTSLEQRFLQLTQNTTELRRRELAAIAETNRELQLQIWSFEDFTQELNTAKTALTAATQAIETAQNAITQLQTTATDAYVAATQQVATAQQNVVNVAIEAARRMRDFGKSIREFISSQLTPATSGTGNLFAQTAQLALGGNTEALQEIAGVAQQAIDSAKRTAQSAAEFAQARAAILAKVSEVAAFAETEAARTVIPLDDDPLIAANRALELAIIEQTKAQEVANAIGASLVKTPEDLIAKYTVANQDLATAIANKLQSEESQARAQAALDAIVANTSKLITTISPSNELQFARGGVFSNKVITGATRFQFGEMGEAGPEAVMPLTRTRDGSLGVIAQPVSQSSLTDAMLGQNLELVAEVRALREEVNLLRFEARATASSTNKTTRILERVTRNGESLIITDSATL